MDRRSRVRPLIALLALASASPARPQDPPPQTPASAAYPAAGQTEPDAPGRETEDPLLGPGRAFELTLDGAWAIALERNLGLRIQDITTEIARYNARGSWGAFEWNLTATAGLFDAEFQSKNTFSSSAPEISTDTQSFQLDLIKPLFLTGGTFGATWNTDNTRTDNQFNVFDTATTDVLTLSLTQPLLRGGGKDYATSLQQEAELEYQRQIEIQRAARQSLLLEVSDAYWDLVAAREQLEVALANLELGREQVRQEHLRLDAGVGTEVDVLQAETQAATREERRIFFEFQVRQTMDRLKQLLFPGTREDLWETTLIPTTPAPAEVSADAALPWVQCMRIAIDNRSELRQQRLTIDQAEVEHSRAVSGRLAGLDLRLTASSEGFDGDPDKAFTESFSYDFPTYQASLSYNIPIGNTTARYAEKAAWAAVRSARLVYDRSESDIVASVRQASRQVVYQAEAVLAAVQSLALAERQLEAEQARYAEDLSTTFQLLAFQQTLLEAQSTERRARVDYARSLVRLDAALGVIGEVAPH